MDVFLSKFDTVGGSNASITFSNFQIYGCNFTVLEYFLLHSADDLWFPNEKSKHTYSCGKVLRKFDDYNYIKPNGTTT